MLTNLNSLLPVLVMICSKSVPICNCFRGTLFWRPRLRVTLSPKSIKFCRYKLGALGQLQLRFRDPSLHRFNRLQCVTDGQTDLQTPRPWLRRVKHSAIARIKNVVVCRMQLWFRYRRRLSRHTLTSPGTDQFDLSRDKSDRKSYNPNFTYLICCWFVAQPAVQRCANPEILSPRQSADFDQRSASSSTLNTPSRPTWGRLLGLWQQ